MPEIEALAAQGEPRSCGECRACCTWVGVVLSAQNIKPLGVPCQHLNPKGGSCNGCLVHKQAAQPSACRQYECDWKRYGWFKRPDLGWDLIFESMLHLSLTQTGPIAYHVLAVTQMSKGAWRRAEGKVLRNAKSTGQEFVFIVLPFGHVDGDPTPSDMEWVVTDASIDMKLAAAAFNKVCRERMDQRKAALRTGEFGPPPPTT